MLKETTAEVIEKLFKKTAEHQLHERKNERN